VDSTGTSIRGFSWFDRNENGLQDPDEDLPVPCRVTLTRLNGNVFLDELITETGSYHFSGLLPGLGYELIILPLPVELNSTIQDVGDDENLDSDILTDDGPITSTFMIEPGEEKQDVDVGWVGNFCGGIDPLIEMEGQVFLPCDQSTMDLVPSVTEGFSFSYFRDGELISEGPTLENATAGNYTVIAEYPEDGCEYNRDFEVVAQGIPPIDLIASSSSDPCVSAEPYYFVQLTGLPINARATFDIHYEGPPLFDTTNLNRYENPSFRTNRYGLYTVTVTDGCNSIATATLFLGEQLCSNVSGNVFLDFDQDCEEGVGDLLLPNHVVTLTNTENDNTFYTQTDAAGNWGLDVPQGLYQVEAGDYNPALTEACDPLLFDLQTDVEDLSLGIKVLQECPVLRTQVTIPWLRRCFPNTAYVDYRNAGFSTAENSMLIVEIDPFWIDVSTSISPASVEGNIYTFLIGDLPPLAEGRVGFEFTISCDAELGQAHCVESRMTPNDYCGGEPDWQGGLVEIMDAVCDGDSVRFTVSNVGDGPMTTPLTYVVVEDGIMLSVDPQVNGALQPGEDYIISVAADGGTYGLFTNQEPGAPGEELPPSVVLEGCNGNPMFSTGFTNLLPLATGDPTSSLVCRENVGSYDPNDKTGYPLGWDNGNIAYGTSLDYEIRFQNTGTDTAFTVVIRDTLSEALDLSSFRMKAASHDYVVTIDTHRVVTWTFNNILLPDSTTNLAFSQGAILFSIDHDASLAPGDEILNKAAIYFDFNEPIITNVSRHMIAREGLPTGVRRAEARSVPLVVSPNPAGDVIRVEVAGGRLNSRDVLKVTDVYGRTIETLTSISGSDQVDVSQLSPGYYLVVLTDMAGRVRGRTAFVVVR